MKKQALRTFSILSGAVGLYGVGCRARPTFDGGRCFASHVCRRAAGMSTDFFRHIGPRVRVTPLKRPQEEQRSVVAFQRLLSSREVVRNRAEILMFLIRQMFLGRAPIFGHVGLFVNWVSIERVTMFGDDRPSDRPPRLCGKND